ncbi:MAG: ABC transporter ATP-binding protein [Hyphomicrobiaceae bacterium]
MMGTALELRGISKSFGQVRVLDDVWLSVEPGEFISLVGPSGCGKSTLLRIIAGLEFQDGGQVGIGGETVDHLSPRARNIAMVFQSYALYPHMSAYDNIALPLTVSRLSLLERLPVVKYLSPRRTKVAREIGTDVRAVASQLQIEPLLARKPGQLSGGQRQRVALARAMVRQPSVFLMDEPLSNLDAQLRVHMRDELADLHARLGATFVYVTHDQVEAMTMSNRVAMLDQGRLIQVGPPRELYDKPASLTVARFIGSPTINVLPASVVAGGQIILFGRPLPMTCNLRSGAAVSLGIRPEAVRIAAAGSGGGLPARVRRVEHHGAERLVFADLVAPATGTLIVRVSGSGGATVDLAVGASVAAVIDPERTHVFDEAGQRFDAHRVAGDMPMVQGRGTVAPVSAMS